MTLKKIQECHENSCHFFKINFIKIKAIRGYALKNRFISKQRFFLMLPR